MKLLLTSSGITNNSIANALFDLVWKKAEEITLVFIPTAANAELGDKTWMIDDLIYLKKLNFKSIEITDISAVSEDIYLESFNRADVLLFEWWNTYHLMKCLHKTKLTKKMFDLLKDKVYVGVSAGSMITAKDLWLKLSSTIYDEDNLESEELLGFNFVDFYFLPHLNSDWFKKVRKENIEKLSHKIKEKIYALDDNSALKIVDNNIEVISEWEYLIFN